MKKSRILKLFVVMGMTALTCLPFTSHAQESLTNRNKIVGVEEKQAENNVVSVETPTQEEIIAKYEELKIDRVSREDGIDYSLTAPYAKGTLQESTLNNALNALNFVRYVAGIPSDVTLNETYNSLAQAASLVNAVNNELTHYPDQPEGMTDELYLEGADGADSSNIAMGYQNLAMSVVDGYMRDDDEGNIARLGHRLWVINPAMKQVGFGKVDAYSAMYAHDRSRTNTPNYEYLPWPAANMPMELMEFILGGLSAYPWSVNLGSAYMPPNAAEVEVVLTDLETEQSWTFNQATSSYDGNYFNVNNQGFGMSKCIIFRPDVDEVSYEAGKQFQVEITGIQDRKGNDTSLSYTVDFFELVKKIPITSVELSDTALEMEIGDSYILKASVYPEDTTYDQKLTWTSSNRRVAIVDQNGVITAVGEGSAVIRVKTVNDQMATCQVTVKKAVEEFVEMQEFVLDKTAVSLKVGETEEINLTILPENATEKIYAWSIDRPEIVSVRAKGATFRIEALKAGEAKITISYGNIKPVCCVINVTEDKENTCIRIAGRDRYETGYLVADELKETLGVDQFEAVIVATGKDFADALAGSYLASVKNAPILLTNGKQNNVDELHEYIQENVKKGGMVYILGGPVAVPKSVEAIKGFTVKRFAGDDRYDTNIKILKEAGITGNEIIAATGKDFADSLSASATKLPILLVNPRKALNDEQKAIAEKAKDGKIYIVGGESAVSKDRAAELAKIASVERIAGNDRYETSIKIANKFFDKEKVNQAVVAYAKDYPDGLGGGVLAAAMDVPMLLTIERKAGLAADYVKEAGIKAGFALGGDAALSNKTIVDVFSLESEADIVVKAYTVAE